MRGTRALGEALARPASPGDLGDALLALLADRSEAADADLPDTGLPLARERALSAAMIVDPDYGTRCATVLLWAHDGQWTLVERRFAADGQVTGTSTAHQR